MLKNRRWSISGHYSHYIIFPYFKILIHFNFCLFYRTSVRHAVYDLLIEMFINQTVLNCVLRKKTALKNFPEFLF